jgi:outer membrane protein assembly factor BamA
MADMGWVLSGAPETIEEEEDGRFLIAPIPFLNPTIGYGLALGGAYLVPLGKDSPPSTIGGGAMYSENGTFGGALAFKGYFDEDRYRVTAGALAVRVNYDLTLADAGEIPLQQSVAAFGLEFLVRAIERVFIGPQLILNTLETSLRRDEDSGVIPDDELDSESLAVGLRCQRDTRDSTFYPRDGSFADLQLRLLDPALGSATAYQILPIAYNTFYSPGPRDVIGVRASARFAFGDVPFYGESFFGSRSDLRGYTVGTIHDSTLLAVQAEYRRELFWRLGAVAFAGVGAVAPDLNDIGDSTALPSVGFGARITLEEKNHVNFRIDFAWGEGQSAIYFGVGEAF